jgi:hypothetical protein
VEERIICMQQEIASSVNAVQAWLTGRMHGRREYYHLAEGVLGGQIVNTFRDTE